MGKRRRKHVYVVFDEIFPHEVEGVFSTEKKVQQYLDRARQILMMRVCDHSTVRMIEDPDNAVRHRYFRIDVGCLFYGFHVEKCEVHGSEDFDKKNINSVWAVTSIVEPWVSYLFMNKRDAEQGAKDVKDMMNGEEVFINECQVG
jgi:hypothetical protein